MSKTAGGHAHLAHHHHHHHRQHHAGGGGGGGSSSLRRRNFAVVLLVLVGVLVANMLLLMPQLHASDGVGWHLGSLSHAGASPGKSIKASSGQQQQQLGGGGEADQQQAAAAAAAGAAPLKQPRGAAAIAPGDFVAVFDADRDGVLGPAEFDALAQEACRNDRARLGLLSRVRRVIRLAFGLHPAPARLGDGGSSGYPCGLSAELVALTGRGAAAGGAGAGDGRRRVRKAGGGADGVAAAAGAAGAAAVDPDSPEGRAAARSAALLAGCSKLTPELAQAAASKGTVLVVAADWPQFELFGVNWLTHVQRAGLDYHLIAALDQRTADFLRTNKLGHCVLWSADAGPSAAGDGPLPKTAPPYAPGSHTHRLVSWTQLQVAGVLLSWGFDVVTSELDTVWLTDPLPYLGAHVPPAADLLLSVDLPANATLMASGDAGLLQPPAAALSAATPAVAFLRATDAAAEALAQWLDGLAGAAEGGAGGAGAALPYPADAVAAWLRQPGLVARPHPEEPATLLLLSRPAGLWARLLGGRRTAAAAGGAAVGVLSPVALANSYGWFVQGVGSRAAAVAGRGGAGAAPGRKLPLGVQMGAGGSAREGRLHRMREAQWYADGPRYYTEPKLMAFDLTPYSHPAATAHLANSPAAPQSQLLELHLAGLRHQLGQLYSAAAAAVALGRVLVLPRFQCYCYRDPDAGHAGGPPPWMAAGWAAGGAAGGAGWACRAPGDDASAFPFNCTADQLLATAALYSHPPVFAGRPLNFREAGFLTNPRTPSWVRHAATSVSSGSPAGCDAGAKCAQVLPGKPPPGINQQVVVPPGLTDAELLAVLKPFEGAKYLHFTDITSVLGGFANANHRAEFERWLDRLVLPWCCKASAAGGAPGTEAGAAAAGGGGAGAAAAAAAGEAGNAPVPGEVPTAVPGWAMVPVKALAPGSSSLAASDGAGGGGGGGGGSSSSSSSSSSSAGAGAGAGASRDGNGDGSGGGGDNSSSSSSSSNSDKARLR